MAQTLFKQNGGAYTQQGNYLIPDIKLPIILTVAKPPALWVDGFLS